jgi:hypothetical protein
VAAAFIIDKLTREMQNNQNYPWENNCRYHTGQHHHQPYVLRIIIKAVIIEESQEKDPDPQAKYKMNNK